MYREPLYVPMLAEHRFLSSDTISTRYETWVDMMGALLPLSDGQHTDVDVMVVFSASLVFG